MERRRKSRQSKGPLLVAITLGFLFTGLFINEQIHEKAASRTMNHGEYTTINKAVAKELPPEVGTKDVSLIKLDSELFHVKYVPATFWVDQQERKKGPQPIIAPNVPQPTDVNDQAIQQHDSDGSVNEQHSTNVQASQPPVKAVDGIPSDQKNPQSENKDAKKTIFLTFDDGPSAYSNGIIDLLEAHHDKATFFMIDGNIRRYPAAVKKMVQTGETVGLHSVSHNPKIFYASVDSILGELTQNRQTLLEISGVESYIMRTPYGSVPYMTAEYRKAVQDHGYIMWDWNIDSRDWDYKDSRYVTSVINQLANMTNHTGPIVILLHERKETLAHLPELLDFLTKHGFESKAIDTSMTPVQFRQ